MKQPFVSLTDYDSNAEVWVNLSRVVEMRRHEEHTSLWYGISTDDDPLNVIEPPEVILEWLGES